MTKNRWLIRDPFVSLLLAVAIGSTGCMGAAQPGSPTDPPSDPLTGSPAGLSTPSTAPTLPPGPLPSAPATPDVFCQKYATTIEWADAGDDSALRPYLVELLRRLDDMRSVAPSFLLDDMDVLIAYAVAVRGEDYASVYALMQQVPGAAASLNRQCNVAENPLMEF